MTCRAPQGNAMCRADGAARKRTESALPARSVPGVRVVCWMALCLLFVGSTAAQANLLPDLYVFKARPEPVPLALGSVLFYFYQEDHRATLSEALYVEQRFARAGEPMPGRDQLLLAKGSAALGLGMLVAARGWLDEVNPAALPETALPRLHLALARVAFLDGDDARARDFVSRLPPEYAERSDVSYLRAELARRQGGLDSMAAALAGLRAEEPLWYFGWHNYAVAARAANDKSQALAAFDRLAQSRPESPEARDIAVRAGLQGAMLRYEDGDLTGAISRIDRVPVAGTYGRTALAQRAQLALAQQDFRTAARVFNALAAPADNRWDSERVDALIGVPFIQEQTVGGAAALAAYGRAADRLTERVQTLQALDAGLDDGKWLASLVAIEDLGASSGIGKAQRRAAADRHGDDAGDEDDADDAADDDADEAQAAADEARLTHEWKGLDAQLVGVDWPAWLAAGETQRDLLVWRRLGDAAQRLQLLSDSSAALGEAATEQERRVARAAGRVRDVSVVARIDVLEQHLAQQQAALNALSERDMWHAADAVEAQRALATAEERAQLARLDRAHGALTQLIARRATASASGTNGVEALPEWALAQRVKRLRGVLSYRIAEEAAQRVWQQEKQRRVAATRLNLIDLRGARIAQAEQERKADAGAAQKVDQLRARLQHLAARAAQLRDEREQLLTAGLRARIAADRADSEKQLAYARLAMARIADAELNVLPAAHGGAH